MQMLLTMMPWRQKRIVKMLRMSLKVLAAHLTSNQVYAGKNA